MCGEALSHFSPLFVVLGMRAELASIPGMESGFHDGGDPKVKVVMRSVGVGNDSDVSSNELPILRLDDGEHALLAAARHGDPEAIEALCRSGWRPVFRSLARYTDDPAEAEDLTQEVFVRALRSLPRFVDRGIPFTAYLLRIADNLARDRWRRGPSRIESLDGLSDRPSERPGPEHGMLRGDRREALLNGLDQIALPQRMVLRMRFLEGRTTQEIATLTGRSAAAVRQIQVRGLNALRNALGAEWSANGPDEKGPNGE
jgi:RNA polymerase sigma-70 factor (ECF subfamily)